MAGEPRHVVCLVIDGLRASALGPYGAAWCETPGFNRLAAESLALDFCFANSPELAAAYRAFWQGVHPLRPVGPGWSLPAWLAGRRWHTTLLTDSGPLAEHPMAAGFTDRILLPRSQHADVSAELEGTHLAGFFTAAVELLEPLAGASQPTLLWLHTQGMYGPWDAPLALRDSLVDEDDPQPPRDAEVPDRQLPADFDPDEALAVTYAYSGQVMALDGCLTALIEALHLSGLSARTLLVVTANRGFCLGEHRRLGLLDGALFGELLHVPCLVRFPEGRGRLTRLPSLVQQADIPATIAHWIDGSPISAGADGRSLSTGSDQQRSLGRQQVCFANPRGERAIRTPGWYLRLAGDGPPQLFAKPDDRWEVNEVSDRCPDIVAGLRAALEQYQRHVFSGGSSDDLPPLAAQLVEPPE